jgi:hypothetical protein
LPPVFLLKFDFHDGLGAQPPFRRPTAVHLIVFPDEQQASGERPIGQTDEKSEM